MRTVCSAAIWIGSRIASPEMFPEAEMLAMIAGYRRKPGQNPTLLASISPRIPVCTAPTNSSRAAMLIRLIISPADENRSGANQMRQQLSEHFGIRERRAGRARQRQQPQRLFEQDRDVRGRGDRNRGSARPQQQL